MDADHFDVVTRLFSNASSRRGALRGLVAGGLTALVGERLALHDIAAKNKRRKKRKKKL